MARFTLLCFLFAAALTSSLTSAGDENHVYSPCSDFTARSAMDYFWNCLHGERFFLWYQSFRSVFSMRSLSPLAPCDRRRLSLNGNFELVLFRPKVDEITLLTINTSSSSSSYCPVRSRLSDL
ncbi:hypothetical protein DY000_02039836 [Brassica cretica]|uniref:Secreted protein n=1 Tax=Brassica cretica TaxID=69181 RepID=A0ABQ7BBW2_BRACR|nr:hypothetical protein DY000_02039836 [Brassica cretica]